MEELTKHQKRAVRKQAVTVLVEEGEVYLEKKERKVKVISSVQEQKHATQMQPLDIFWCHKDAQTDHLEVLMKEGSCRCEKLGKQCVV